MYAAAFCLIFKSTYVATRTISDSSRLLYRFFVVSPRSSSTFCIGHGVAYFPSPVNIILVLAYHIRQLILDKWLARNEIWAVWRLCCASYSYERRKKNQIRIHVAGKRVMSHRMRFVCACSEQFSVGFPLRKYHYLFIPSTKECVAYGIKRKRKKKRVFEKQLIFGEKHTHT